MTYPYTKLRDILKQEEKRLFIIVGNDSYLISNCVKHILRVHPNDEIVRFDVDDLDSDALSQAFITYPFFAKRVVIIDNFNPAKQNASLKKFFEQLFESIPDYLTVVLTNYIENRFNVNKQYELLADNQEDSVIITAEKPVGRQAIQMITQLSKTEGVEITPDAAEHLIFLTGDDLFSILFEIKKLAALSGYTTIEKKHVERITVKSTESSVFNMISALERRDIRSALQILEELSDNHVEPILVSSTLNTAFINLYRAKLISLNKRYAADMFNLFDYRKGDKKVEIALSRCSSYSKAQLSNILDILIQLDIDLKSPSLDSTLLLDQAIIEIHTTRA